MTTITGNPYQCAAGHRQYLPYAADSIRSWCEPCGSMSDHAAVRAAVAVTPEDARDIQRVIAGKFRSLANTWDASGRGDKVALVPDPKNDRDAAIMAALASAHFPARHIATLPAMDAAGKECARSVLDALSGPGPATVILWGDYGTGKTQTATAVAMLRHQRGKRTRYVSAPALTRALRDNFSTKIPEAELLRRFHECAGLVIDEIQAALDENPDRSSWARTQIQGIVDTRYASAGPLKTILICNADSEAQLARRLGAHILSRAKEAGQVFHVARNNYRADAARRYRQPHAD